MASITETFQGKYKAELETNFNGEGGTGVWISYKTKAREYTASLETLLNYGELEDSKGNVHDVEQAIIDDIEKWAMENGY